MMFNFTWFVGSNSFPSMDPLVPKNVSSWGKKTIQMQKKIKVLDEKRNHPSHAKTALTKVCLTRFNTFSACLTKIIENYTLQYLHMN